MLYIGLGLLFFVALPLGILARKDEHGQRGAFAGVVMLLALLLIFLSAGG
jgi:hypothetical protein